MAHSSTSISIVEALSFAPPVFAVILLPAFVYGTGLNFDN